MSICWYTTSAFRSLPRNHSSSVTTNKLLILGMTRHSVPALAHQTDLRNISSSWVGLICLSSRSWESTSQALPCMILFWQSPSINWSCYCLWSSILARRACDYKLGVIFFPLSVTNFCFPSTSFPLKVTNQGQLLQYFVKCGLTLD